MQFVSSWTFGIKNNTGAVQSLPPGCFILPGDGSLPQNVPPGSFLVFPVGRILNAPSNSWFVSTPDWAAGQLPNANNASSTIQILQP